VEVVVVQETEYQEQLWDIELQERRFNLSYQKITKKHEKIDMMLKVISTLSQGYVSDKRLKDGALDKAAQVLNSELHTYQVDIA
jgi:hypothetical protein